MAVVSADSLRAYRAGFGILGFIAVLRFFAYGWIDEFYVDPGFHFTYAGLEWLRPWPGWGMHAHFAVMGLAALAVAFGVWHRLATALYFLMFTYVELLDKTYYLNHYYLVSLLAALMVFMPIGRRVATAPRWCLWTLRAQVGLVYVFAGVAKLKSDWLLAGQPLHAWLTANADVPLIGPLLLERSTAIAGAWAAAAFDLSVPFLLLWRRTRPWALAAVVGFHLITGYFFQLGLFPAIMIWNALLFLEPDWPRPWLPKPTAAAARSAARLPRWGVAALAAHFALQLALPLRHHAYGDDVTWTEDGFRFAWNVMLIEKSGLVRYQVRDPASGRSWEVLPDTYLSTRQIEMMATQPDMILQLAHHVRDDFASRGLPDVEVRADAYAALNGRRSERLIDPDVDLAQVAEGLRRRDWVLPRSVSGAAFSGQRSPDAP